MLKDRGSIKWVSLMLPEHVKMLRDWKNDAQNDWKAPLLDEHRLEEMNMLMYEAITHDLSLTFTLANASCPETVTGKIQWIHEVNRNMKIQDHNMDCRMIKLDQIIDIKPSDD